MEVEFHGGSVYQFFDVPANAYQALKEAPSIGVHFHRQIKGQFRYARRT
jgi:hypothetical protein